jgi:uncharacterized protein YutE (UPF0331/DUF86 family)
MADESLYLKKLDTINDCLKKLDTLLKETASYEDYAGQWKNKDIAERNLQKVFEAIFDIGKMLISDRELKTPDSNREVFEILIENGLFPVKLKNIADKMTGMRNILVHGYDRVDDKAVYSVLTKHTPDIKKIVESLKDSILPNHSKFGPKR